MAIASPRHDYESRRAEYYTGIAVVRPCEPKKRLRFRIYWEERIAFVLLLVAILWTVQIITGNLNRSALWQTPGPAEIAAAGFVLWMHAKWRRLLKAD
jgi:hypothetical protein